MAHALRPLPSPGEHAHQALGVARVVEQALLLQLGNGGGYGLGVVTLAQQSR